MNLIALLIGLFIERLATQFFHLRELRWLDGIIDRSLDVAARFGDWPALAPVVALVVLLTLPVLAVMLALGDALLGFPYLLLAVVVLFFSLGPKDIGEDVDEYCKALEDGDAEDVRRTAKIIVEKDLPEDLGTRISLVEQAVCVQANNRLFAVIFWFILLGPAGAWAYRLSDLVRRRAVFKANREEEPGGPCARARDAATTLHGWLAWIPARLTAIGYAIAGHFDAAISAWRDTPDAPATTSERSEQLLARVGVGALDLVDDDGETLEERGVRGATAANRLVFRQFLIWAVIIAGMTLYGLVS